MAEVKTKPTSKSVAAFLDTIDDESRRKDCRIVLQMMKRVTGEKPAMWGPGMIGFGTYHYKYASGREGDIFVTGFAPRKNDVTLYVQGGLKRYERLLAKLGKYSNSQSCLHVKRLADVDLDILQQLIEESVAHVKQLQAQ